MIWLTEKRKTNQITWLSLLKRVDPESNCLLAKQLALYSESDHSTQSRWFCCPIYSESNHSTHLSRFVTMCWAEWSDSLKKGIYFLGDSTHLSESDHAIQSRLVATSWTNWYDSLKKWIWFTLASLLFSIKWYIIWLRVDCFKSAEPIDLIQWKELFLQQQLTFFFFFFYIESSFSIILGCSFNSV